MTTTVDVSIVMQKALFEQAQILAQDLNISQNQFFESAIETYVNHHQRATPLVDTQLDVGSQPVENRASNRLINQGDIYWVVLDTATESSQGASQESATAAPMIPHPYVVIQGNILNHSRITTVVACALTSNIRRISNTPGNILLESGEANLPKQSVIEVSKISTLEKSHLGEYIGSLSESRVGEILAGMRFLQRTFFAR